MKTGSIRVETYQLIAGNGRPIRKATAVVFPDGKVVRFTERMGRGQAVAQAMVLRQREGN